MHNSYTSETLANLRSIQPDKWCAMPVPPRLDLFGRQACFCYINGALKGSGFRPQLSGGPEARRPAEILAGRESGWPPACCEVGLFGRIGRWSWNCASLCGSSGHRTSVCAIQRKRLFSTAHRPGKAGRSPTFDFIRLIAIGPSAWYCATISRLSAGCSAFELRKDAAGITDEVVVPIRSRTGAHKSHQSSIVRHH